MEKGGVNMGMFPSRYSSLMWVERTLWDTLLFSVMIPGEKVSKPLQERDLQQQTTFPPVKMHVECADVQFMLFILPKVMEQRG
jgi:hypothetical protein